MSKIFLRLLEGLICFFLLRYAINRFEVMEENRTPIVEVIETTFICDDEGAGLECRKLTSP